MPVSHRAACLALVLASVAACGDQGPLVETVETDVPSAADRGTVADRPRTTDGPRAADGPVVLRDAGVVARDVPAAAMDAGAPDTGTTTDDPTPDLRPDGGAPVLDAEPTAPTMGATLRVTAGTLNLRGGVGTSHAILTVLSCGARVTVVGGPTTGWWNIRAGAFTGWASGAYLVAEAGFDAGVCGGEPGPTADAGTPPGPTTTMPGEVSQMFVLARSAVGYSYYWGHGSWGLDGSNQGSCSGSCPSCSHTGIYGADCSGFVAKVWQIPSASPVTTDRHPYSTYNFVNSATHWSRVNRTTLRPGDALTYNTDGAGHIALFEAGSDPWGSVWVFEARGCATGVVHNLRVVGSNYVAIRREGL